jgi:hypothetical protein
MKARELIEKLQDLDPEAEIISCCCSYCEGEPSGVLDVSQYEFRSYLSAGWKTVENVEGMVFMVSGSYPW